MGMASGDSVVESRDRAILKFFLYSGARLGTGCRLKVSDFHRDGDECTRASPASRKLPRESRHLIKPFLRDTCRPAG